MVFRLQNLAVGRAQIEIAIIFILILLVSAIEAKFHSGMSPFFPLASAQLGFTIPNEDNGITLVPEDLGSSSSTDRDKSLLPHLSLLT
jgi:hypothetical protein